MLAPADALPLALKRAGQTRRRQAVARSGQGRRDDSGSDSGEIGREAAAPYDHRGIVVVASAWLAFYVVAAIHGFIASGY